MLKVFFVIVLAIVETQDQWCTCDLTQNACDINCCCDPDCSAEDKDAFSSCVDVSSSNVKEVCVSDAVLLSANGKYKAEGSGDGLFCIYQDNYAERNFYSSVQTPNTQDEFDRLAQQYMKTSYEVSNLQALNFEQPYKYGDPVLIMSKNNVIGYMSQPSPSFSSMECDDSNVAGYLKESVTSCSRLVSNLETDCSSSTAWSGHTYYEDFKVAPAPSVFLGMTRFLVTNTSNSTEVVIQPAAYEDARLVEPTLILPPTCVNVAGSTSPCPFNHMKAPSYDAATGVCSNVVQKVSYKIEYSSVNLTISKVEVEITLMDISKNLGSFQQHFSVQYMKNGSKASMFKRSGNPGYLVGYPLMAGKLQTDKDTKKQVIILNLDNRQWLTVMQTPSDGFCAQASQRLSVMFGEDRRTGCFMSVKPVMTLSECELMQDTIYNTLLQQLPTHVAMFGNSEVTNIEDWAPIIDNRPTTKPTVSSGYCQNMILGVTLEILHAKAGYLGNAQNKIAGVSIKYNSPQDITYQCFGSRCQQASVSQNIEIVQAVSFIDVSTTPVVKVKPRPPWESKAPHDFFYPFV